MLLVVAAALALLLLLLMPSPVFLAIPVGPCAGFDARHCKCTADSREFRCHGAGFEAVPPGISPAVVKLDLTSNNITEIDESSFSHLVELEELVLSDNKLESLHPRAFVKNSNLKRIVLQGCGLQEVPAEALKPLTKLSALQLRQNELWRLDGKSLETMQQLRSLSLEGNRLSYVPTEALAPVGALEVLNLGNNLLTTLPTGSFPQMENLLALFLKRNQISHIDENAFVNISSLRVLEMDDNLLTDIPTAITKLPDLQELSVSGNRIKYIPAGVLQRCPNLALLQFRGNPLVGVDPHAFSFLPHLHKLILSDARELSIFPSLNGTRALEILRLDRANLSAVPSTLCVTCPKLRSLDMKSNRLTKVPDLNKCNELRLLDLASNLITSLEGKPFRGISEMQDLLLAHNNIQYIPQDAFYNLSKLQVLDLENNQISFIHPDAFLPIPKIEDLNLGYNVYPKLPSAGLENLLHLKTFNNPNLRDFPEPENFRNIQTLVLSYAYHCCAFLPLIASEPAPRDPITETVLFPTDTEFDISLWNLSHVNIFPHFHNLSKKFGPNFTKMLDTYGLDFVYPANFPSYQEEYGEDEKTGTKPPRKIQCLPLPGPFLPCQDLFDWWTLRCGVWIVFLLAMLGNGTVVFVLIFSRSKMDVPRFLVCNLAAADFFMGIYLGFLAVVDASTLGEFRMYAIPWQMSAGCQLAGFLGVLSSELSVYTLAVITLERNYAITHAMHLNKRLSLKHAGYIMACGWTFALVMAVLPLLGISDYRKFAICLPFETTTGPASLTYVVFLMFINGVAFFTLMGCYLKMYCAIRGSQAWNSNDSRIAKRMALLVFTDFLCWSPIAFFSLTAAFGLQLITLEQAKVFTVFVLPLNSCSNPFLYAILTKQFKKDCVLICKAIEESRVTRGIGRCRHSSNFSNRQTPANTNSLVDRSSRDHQHHGHTHCHAHAHSHSHAVPPCACSVKLLGDVHAVAERGIHVATAARGLGANSRAGGSSAARTAVTADVTRTTAARMWFLGKARWLLCTTRRADPRHRTRSDQYAYQIAEIQQKQHKRASSVSSSENFSSSRSDSWRQNHHHCGIPLRLLDPKRRASSWLVTRKTSQDSNLSSSRNDSSGSATTASTSTWRMSRSSASSDVRGTTAAAGVPVVGGTCVGGPEGVRPRAKPRLTRQSAIQDEPEPPGSPGRLTVRFLTTIPSAAENSMQLDDDGPTSTTQASPPARAVLHVTPSTAISPAHSQSAGGAAYFAVLHAAAGAPLTRPRSVLTLHPVSAESELISIAPVLVSALPPVTSQLPPPAPDTRQHNSPSSPSAAH